MKRLLIYVDIAVNGLGIYKRNCLVLHTSKGFYPSNLTIFLVDDLVICTGAFIK